MATQPLSTATAAFGERVRHARHALGDSQERLAERSGLHWSFIGQVERGRRNVSLHNILKLWPPPCKLTPARSSKAYSHQPPPTVPAQGIQHPPRDKHQRERSGR